MSLYVCSMWAHIAEVRRWKSETQEDTATRPRYVDIPFDRIFPVANSWAQRISTEPMMPRPESMQFATVSQGPEFTTTTTTFNDSQPPLIRIDMQEDEAKPTGL